MAARGRTPSKKAPLIEVIESGELLRRTGRTYLTPHIIGSVLLYFDTYAIKVAANPDTEEIVLSRSTRAGDGERIAPDPILQPVGTANPSAEVDPPGLNPARSRMKLAMELSLFSSRRESPART